MLTLGWVFLLSFLLLHAMPGDPAERVEIPGVPPEQAERTRVALGLDRPLPVQLLETLVSYARGDLGTSFGKHRPVADVLADALPATALLGAAALLLAYGLGVPGAIVLLRLPPRLRHGLGQGAWALATIPRFWLAVMLVLLFHSVTGWLPASHASSPGGGDWIDRLRHLVLPALALGLPAAAAVLRYQLRSMERVLAAEHIKAARASGAWGFRLLIRHVLRPSLGPAVALFGLDLSVLVSGALVVEIIFAWPGVGRVTAEAILGSDYPLALAASLLAGTAVVVGRLLSELVASRLDPRQGEVS